MPPLPFLLIVGLLVGFALAGVALDQAADNAQTPARRAYYGRGFNLCIIGVVLAGVAMVGWVLGLVLAGSPR